MELTVRGQIGWRLSDDQLLATRQVVFTIDLILPAIQIGRSRPEVNVVNMVTVTPVTPVGRAMLTAVSLVKVLLKQGGVDDVTAVEFAMVRG